MTINVVQLVLIVVFGSLAYWANEKINTVPTLKQVVSVVIVVVSVVLLVASLFGGFNTHIQIN